MPGLHDTLAMLARQKKTAARSRKPPAPSRLVETKDFGDNPGELRMLSYRPARLAPGAPLVVVLHGCTQTANDYAEGAGWLTLADRYGFAVLAPEQTRQNNPNLCFNWFSPKDTARGAGEAQSICSMVARAIADNASDPARVFVTGLSAGGAMTSVMLAAWPEVFAAGAVIAGLPYGAASNVQEAFVAMLRPGERTADDWGSRVRAASSHAGPWPRVSIWHGDADPTVRASNADAIAAQWANVHGLGAAVESEDSLGHRRQVWTAPDGATAVSLVTVRGMGHGTPLAVGGPDGCGVAGPFMIETGLSSSAEIAAFWGITAPAGRRDEPVASPDVEATPKPVVAEVAPPKRDDRGGIVAKVLRAAGLRK